MTIRFKEAASFLLFAMVALTTSLQSSPCHAADNDKPAEKKSDAKKVETKIESETAEDEANPLDAAIAGMRSAQNRIEASDTGIDTRRIQQEVVDNLSKLIRMAEQNSKRSRNRSQSSQTDENQKDQPDQDDQQQEQGEQRPSPSQRDRKDNAADSQERQSPREKKDVAAREQGAAAEVWGHLPERLRQRLQNIDAGKTLPKYSELVRRYFEALAEQGQKERQKSTNTSKAP